MGVYDEKFVSVLVSKHEYVSDGYSSLLYDKLTAMWSSAHQPIWSSIWSDYWIILCFLSFMSFRSKLFLGLLHGVLMFPKDPGKLVVAHQLLLEVEKAQQWPSRLQNSVMGTSSSGGGSIPWQLPIEFLLSDVVAIVCHELTVQQHRSFICHKLLSTVDIEGQFAHLCEASYVPARRSSFSLTSVPSEHLTISDEVMQWVVSYYCTQRWSCNGDEEDNYDVVHRETLLPATEVATRVMRTIYHSPCYNQVVEYPAGDLFGFHDFYLMIFLKLVNYGPCSLHYAHFIVWLDYLWWEFKSLSPGLWSMIHNCGVSMIFSSAVLCSDSYWYNRIHLFFEISVHKTAAYFSTINFMMKQRWNLTTTIQTLHPGEFLPVVSLITMGEVPTEVLKTECNCASCKLSTKRISFCLHFPLPIFEWRGSIQFWLGERIIHILLTVTFVYLESKLVNFFKWKFKLYSTGFWSMQNGSGDVWLFLVPHGRVRLLFDRGRLQEVKYWELAAECEIQLHCLHLHLHVQGGNPTGSPPSLLPIMWSAQAMTEFKSLAPNDDAQLGFLLVKIPGQVVCLNVSTSGLFLIDVEIVTFSIVFTIVVRIYTKFLEQLQVIFWRANKISSCCQIMVANEMVEKLYHSKVQAGATRGISTSTLPAGTFEVTEPLFMPMVSGKWCMLVGFYVYYGFCSLITVKYGVG